MKPLGNSRVRKSLLSVVLMLSTVSGICQAADTIRINGSGAALDMMMPLIKAYLTDHRNVLIEMENPLGSSGAVKALLDGALDLAVSSKPLRPEDIAKGARQKEYGKTPLAIVTGKGVPKSDITTRELEDIYAGRMTRWKNGETIRLVLRPQSDVDTVILRGLSPGMNAAIDISRSRADIMTGVTDPDAYGFVAQTPGSIGASGLTSLIVTKLPLNILALNGVRPTPQTVASGAYPLVKKIDFVITPGTSPAALEFIKFVYSPQGRAIAEKTGVLVTGVSEPGK
jgi:phosphate transport system substrate-binding protein